MGIALNGFGAIASLYRDFGPLGSTIQIGRQGLYLGHQTFPAVDQMLAERGLSGRSEDLIAGRRYADENLLPAFGASPVTSIDASAYENAEHVHDFNDPVPESLHNRFDTLIDFGSLEHIFNMPTALANMMNMLKLGGRVMHLLPSNNWLGHGFYQFGPELFFRAYQPDNGFKLHSISLSNVEQIEPWTVLSDKGAVGARNEFGATNGPTEIIVVAEKVTAVKPFERWPQQGDYQNAWDNAA